MNSERWHRYPKDADFPMVARCPDCHGTGLRINSKRIPIRYDWDTGEPSSDFYIECTRCAGTGKIIPPEWLGHTSSP